jgi:hypothetical protein
MDIELAVDAMEMARHIDHMVRSRATATPRRWSSPCSGAAFGFQSFDDHHPAAMIADGSARPTNSSTLFILWVNRPRSGRRAERMQRYQGVLVPRHKRLTPKKTAVTARS